MKATEKVNQAIYQKLSELFGVDVRICEHIMRCQFKLVKDEIERPDCWGDVVFRNFGTFSLVKRQADKVKDAPMVKVTDGINLVKLRYVKRPENKKFKRARAVQSSMEPGKGI